LYFERRFNSKIKYLWELLIKTGIYMHSRLLIFIVLIAAGCQKGQVVDPPIIEEGFEAAPITKSLTPGILDEASGIADSKINPGYLWVEQDGGNPNEIALLSHDGSFLKKITIKSAVNKDWEDMTLANGPVAGTNYIYLADVGDNDQVYDQHAIYRFAEPASTVTEVTSSDKISFTYPDGAHDAEALLVDNNTKDIYVITNRDVPARVYKLSYPQSTNAVNQAVFSGTLSFGGATSAASSPDGKEILIKTFDKVYYWKKKKEQTVMQLLAETPVTISYQQEPQGEAICFKSDNSGFFTLSERPSFITQVLLNFYKRK
jgi:hypothetical protein